MQQQQLFTTDCEVFVFDFDCTLSTMATCDKRRRDGGDHSAWLDPKVIGLLHELHAQGRMIAVASFADHATIVHTLWAAGLTEAVPPNNVHTATYRKDEPDARARLKVQMLHEIYREAKWARPQLKRNQLLFIDDNARSCRHALQAGYSVLHVPGDEETAAPEDCDKPCPGVGPLIRDAVLASTRSFIAALTPELVKRGEPTAEAAAEVGHQALPPLRKS